MEKKEFKAESKRLLDMMINSIYTHKEIFLRELISNASDATDKLYFQALHSGNTGLNRSDLSIHLTPDKEARTLTISDKGCGMTRQELEDNLGTIARSGSLAFKQENDLGSDVDMVRMSLTPYFIMARRVRPRPNAKPVYSSGSMPPAVSTLG